MPDGLALLDPLTSVVGVAEGEPLKLADDVHPVAVYKIETSHAEDMGIIYLPNQELMFVSDIYSTALPPFPILPAASNEALQGLGIPVSTFAGGHDGVGSFAEFAALIPGK